MRCKYCRTESCDCVEIENGPDDYAVIMNSKTPDATLVQYNQSGYDSTAIKLSVIINWIRANRPDLL